MLAQPTGNHRRFKRASTWHYTTTQDRVRHTLIAVSTGIHAQVFACRSSTESAQRQFVGRFTIGEVAFEQGRMQTLERRQGSLGYIEARCNLGRGEPRGLSEKPCSQDTAGHCGVAGRAMRMCRTLYFGGDLAN